MFAEMRLETQNLPSMATLPRTPGWLEFGKNSEPWPGKRAFTPESTELTHM